MNDLQNKVIKIDSKEEKASTFGPMIKIKDEKGLSYSVYKNKKDGGTSVAWEQMPNVGDEVSISYKEETKTHPEHGQVTYRTIRGFNKDLAQGQANYNQQAPKLQNGPNMAPQEAQTDTFGRRLTLYGMVNGRLAAGADIESISKELPLLSLLADEIDVIAKRPASMNTAQVKIIQANEEPLPEELPIIQQEDINVDDIPFN